MALSWIAETPPRYDEPKQKIVGGAPKGVFREPGYGPDDVIPGEWWRVEDDGDVVGYGWMDINWGDAEILLAVDPNAQRHGVGTWILDKLEQEARARGLNYMLNVVRPTHPDGQGISAWLEKRGFAATSDGYLRRKVA